MGQSVTVPVSPPQPQSQPQYQLIAPAPALQSPTSTVPYQQHLQQQVPPPRPRQPYPPQSYVSTLISIEDPGMRTKARILLNTIPATTVQQCYDALLRADRKEELAAMELLKVAKDTNQADQLFRFRANEVLSLEMKTETLRLQRWLPSKTIQECYIALKIAGNYEEALQDLDSMAAIQASGRRM